MQPDAEMSALRELAERVTRASLYAGALPENLPLDVPVPPGGRLIGGVRHPPFTPPGGTESLTDERFEVLIDAPGEAADLVSFFEAAFAAQGWQETEEQRAHREQAAAFRARAGAGGRRFPAWLTMSGNGGRTIAVHIEPGDGDVNAIQVSVQPPPRTEHREMERFFRMPEVTAPEGGTLHGGGGGGNDGSMYREWRLETTLGIAETEAYVARQLTAAGWGRRDGGARGPVAWSRWSVPDEPEQESILLILESAVLPRYIVHLRRVGPSDGSIGGGGVIVTRLQSSTSDEDAPASE